MDRKELEDRSVTFASQVFALCRAVRGRPGGVEPASQLQDAASSAAANYRASARARTPREFTAKLGVVNEEADEAVYWLEFIATTALAAGLDIQPLLQESRELRAIFAASYGTSRRRQEERERHLKARKTRSRGGR